MKELIEKILRGNPWLNGLVDFREGDLTAILDQYEKFSSYRECNSVHVLYKNLHSYDGVFKYGNLLFFNDWKYGTFVYNINEPDTYVEHLSMEWIDLKRFQEIIEGLLCLKSK